MTISSTVIQNQQIDYNTDYFEDQESDANGETVLTLTQTPTNVKKIWVHCTKDDRVAVITSLADTSLTVTTYKTQYQRATTVTTTGALTGLPASVSEASSIQSPSSSDSGGTNNDNSGGSTTAPQHSHTTQIGFIYSHNHGTNISETATALNLATSENDLSFVVQYQV